MEHVSQLVPQPVCDPGGRFYQLVTQMLVIHLYAKGVHHSHKAIILLSR